MEDVEAAITILTHFISKAQQAKMLISKVNSVMGQTGGQRGGFNPMNMSYDDFVSMAVAVDKRKKEGPQQSHIEEPPIGDLSEDDVKRMREAVQKMKSKSQIRTVDATETKTA